MSKKPTVLMILDGYGLNDKHEANAVFVSSVFDPGPGIQLDVVS